MIKKTSQIQVILIVKRNWKIRVLGTSPQSRRTEAAVAYQQHYAY